MKLCWIVVLVGISIILVFLYSLVAMSSRTERFIEQFLNVAFVRENRWLGLRIYIPDTLTRLC